MNLINTADVRDAIFASFDNPNTYCIFPNENIRRFWIEDYALKSERGALVLNRILAWDVFSSCFMKMEGKNKGDYTTRYIFSQRLIEHHSDALSYFIQPDFPHLSSNLISSIVVLIGRLASIAKLKMEDNEKYRVLPFSYKKDIEFISSEYKAFLDERGLYDTALIEKCDCEEEKFLTSHVVVFFPDLCTSYSEMEPFVENLPSIEIIRVRNDEKVPLHQYENERLELESTFVNVKKLLNQGVHIDDIVITVGDLKRLRRYVELEANLHQIPLRVVSGTSIFDYSVGAMFLAFKEVYQSNFDTSNVKDLLLNPAFPWREKGLHRNLVERAYTLHIHQRTPLHERNDWKMKLDTSYGEDKNLFQYANRLFGVISKMVTSRSTSQIFQSLSMLQSNFFEVDYFAYDATSPIQSVENQSYTFCLEQLSSLSNQLDICKTELSTSLYSFFLTLLRTKKFNPIGKKEGVKVYDWLHGVGIVPSYHFFISCISEVVDSPAAAFPLLPSSTIEDSKGDILLGYYMVSGEHIIYSYSQGGHTNTANLPPSLFVRYSLLEKETSFPLSLLALEETAWESGGKQREILFSRQQVQGYRYASTTFFSEKKIDVAEKGKTLSIFSYLENSNHLIPLSNSSLEAFEECPFKYLASKVFKVAQKDYEEVIVDHGEIGNIQHKILARFFEEIETTYRAFSSKYIDEMKDILSRIIYEEVKRLYRIRGESDYYIVRYIENHYLNPLIGIISEELKIFDNHHTLRTELDLSYEDTGKGYLLNGRIDRVVTVPLEHKNLVVIIDYKKSKTPSRNSFSLNSSSIPSYQLPLYDLLLQRSPTSPVNRVDSAYYYNIGLKKYVQILSNDQEELKEYLCSVSEMAIVNMVFNLREGILGATPSTKSCSYCDYRQLCRRRYFLP